MKYLQPKIKIGVISTLLPTRCGIATFSDDLINAIRSLNQDATIYPIELTTLANNSSGNLTICQTKKEDYLKAAMFINQSSDIDIVHIQHEFKIFGAPDGENIMLLLRNISKPIITTLHTVSTALNPTREKIFLELLKVSNVLFVFSLESKKLLIRKYNLLDSKVIISKHGIPSVTFKLPNQIPYRKTLKSPVLFVSAGHMRCGKGYEIAIKALSRLKKKGVDFHYIIIGSNHPKSDSVKEYRQLLVDLIHNLCMNDQVTFVNKYLEIHELINLIQAADVGLLPYPGVNQGSSGILALVLACGRPFVSTPFDAAKSYTKEVFGILSDSAEVESFEKALLTILSMRNKWKDFSFKNYIASQKWTWEKIAAQHLDVYKMKF